MEPEQVLNLLSSKLLRIIGRVGYNLFEGLMKKLLFLGILLLGFGLQGEAQVKQIRFVNALPSSCISNISPPVIYQGKVYQCTSGTYQLSGGGIAVGDSPTLTGQWTFATGTITTSKPLSVTQTWNSGGVTFNSFLVNATDTASASGSLLGSFQVGGVERFSVRKDGLTLASNYSRALGFQASDDNFWALSSGRLYVSSGGAYCFGSSSAGSTTDACVRRQAATLLRVSDSVSGTGAGSLLIGTSTGAIGTSGAGVLAFALSTAPTTSPADTVQVYSNDAAAGDHNLYVRTEAGAVNRLTGLSASVATQFDKTSDTTLANVTGLTRNVEAGRTYSFEAVLYTTSNVAGGVKAAISGTATATSIVYEGITTDAGASTQSRATTLGNAIGAVTAVTAARITITGTIVVNAAGTLTVQFAQNTSNGTASSVLVGSTFSLIPIT